MVHDDLTTHDAVRAAAQADRLWSAAGLDVPAAAMSRMHREGALERVIPGVYLGASHPRQLLTEAAAWHVRHPEAVVCLLTAAVYHGLTDAFAGGTWLYVPKGSSPPRSTVVPVHVIQIVPRLIAPEHDRANDVHAVSVHDIRVRITGPDRTTLDLWRYPRRISMEHALEALRRRVQADGFQIPRFARMARRLEVWTKVEPVMQGLVLR